MPALAANGISAGKSGLTTMGEPLSSQDGASLVGKTLPTPLLDPYSLHVRQSNSAGRGVFASRDLGVGTVVEVSHVLLFDPHSYREHGRHTCLDSYTYVWSKDQEGSTMALALGIGSLFNHCHHSPNVSYTLDKSTETIRYTLVRSVAAGEELCISYGAGRMWWENVEEEERRRERLDRLTWRFPDEANGGSTEEMPHKQEEDELLQLGSLELTDEEREEIVSHSIVALAPTPSRKSSSEATSVNDVSLTPPIPVDPSMAPLWRITAAKDPSTTPLELMDVWVIRVDPRKSSNFLKLVRINARSLRRSTTESFGSSQSSDSRMDASEDDEEEDYKLRHLRTFKRMTDPKTGGTELVALIGRVEDQPDVAKVEEILRGTSLTADGRESIPYVVKVPRHPAPSRERLAEWKAHWPVSVKIGRFLNSPAGDQACGGAPSAVISTTVMGEAGLIVDRAADARLWNTDAVEWVRARFGKCIDIARQAKAKGELPIGVYVCPSYGLGNFLSASAGVDVSIEAGAHDTRVSERNPIKHAVTNVIRNVAQMRSERDWERISALGAKVASLQRDADIPLPHLHSGLTGSTPRTTSPSPRNYSSSSSISLPTVSSPSTPPPRLVNGQDYLLNSLSLFTTHEPCMSCCMALVHSRVKAIYFIKPSPGAGGCCGAQLPKAKRCGFAEDGGPYAVQEQTGLNHHFDVWKWVGGNASLAEEDLSELLETGGLDP